MAAFPTFFGVVGIYPWFAHFAAPSREVPARCFLFINGRFLSLQGGGGGLQREPVGKRYTHGPFVGVQDSCLLPRTGACNNHRPLLLLALS